ncbi:hypothetical protein AXG93_4303s1010 [Marchantia polymorpha subsp. ruderalis]|uniref:SOUL heme-binding protein n=1 Tax=Marchantia polymorpha subsp. ruderalis TaxID=1480154 RepID=A0A176WS63_MARPO|nr:hypothetical protein AXG93_4303s1010 [Marchantia polymorpha subsp. ruderalis]
MGREWLRTSPTSDIRLALMIALSSQAARQSQRGSRITMKITSPLKLRRTLFYVFVLVVVESLASESFKYVFPRRQNGQNPEEAFMSVPDLETIPYRVIRKEPGYEIRVVESYMIAETDMSGESGFDFVSSGQAFNTLAEYIFGKNTSRETMPMNTPVLLQRNETKSQKMEMTTPVFTQKASEEGTWRMAFLIPSKFDESNLPIPDNTSVKIRRVPSKTVAVTAFSGFVTEDVLEKKEREIRRALEKDNQVRTKGSVLPEIAQYNPPFTPPFMRRNEVSVEVEYKA